MQQCGELRDRFGVYQDLLQNIILRTFYLWGHGVISQRNGALNHTAAKISQGSQNANFSTTLRFLRETFLACFALQNGGCVKCCSYFW